MALQLFRAPAALWASVRPAPVRRLALVASSPRSLQAVPPAHDGYEQRTPGEVFLSAGDGIAYVLAALWLAENLLASSQDRAG